VLISRSGLLRKSIDCMMFPPYAHLISAKQSFDKRRTVSALHLLASQLFQDFHAFTTYESHVREVQNKLLLSLQDLKTLLFQDGYPLTHNPSV